MTLTAAPALQRVQRMQWESARVVPAADMCKNKWKFTWGGIRLFMKAHAIFQAKPVKNKQTNKQQPIPPKGNRKAPRNLRTPPMHQSPHNVHVPLLKLSQALLAPDSPFPDSEVSDSQREARESSIQSVQPKVRECIWTVSKDHPRLEWCRICRVFSASWCVFLTNLMVFIAGLCLPAPKCSNLVHQSQSTFLGIAMPWSSPSGPKLSPF